MENSVAKALKTIGVVVGIIGLIGGIIIAVTLKDYAFVAFLSVLIGCGISALLLYAFGEVIDLLEGVKNNTSGVTKGFANVQKLLGEYLSNPKDTNNKSADNPNKSNSGVTEPDVENLFKRAFLFLEDGDFVNASRYFDSVLDSDPENARAYLGKLMVDYSISKEEELANINIDFSGNLNYQKALRFADRAFSRRLRKYNHEDVQSEVDIEKMDTFLLLKNELESLVSNNKWNNMSLKRLRELVTSIKQFTDLPGAEVLLEWLNPHLIADNDNSITGNCSVCGAAQKTDRTSCFSCGLDFTA
jgi:tetratricopeptide (TPR) repeat protein